MNTEPIDRCPVCGNKFIKPKEQGPLNEYCSNCMTLIVAGIRVNEDWITKKEEK